MAVTAADIKKRVLYALRDTKADNFPTAGQNYEAEELLIYVNCSVRTLVQVLAAEQPWYLMGTSLGKQTKTNLVSGTTKYSLPADFYEPISVIVNGVEFDPLVDWSDSQDGVTVGYQLRNGMIHLYPSIDSDVTDGLVLDYIARPADVTADGDEVPLGDDMQDAITNLSILQARDRQKEPIGVSTELFDMARRLITSHATSINFGPGHGFNTKYRPFL
jgi:hypothetical protein